MFTHSYIGVSIASSLLLRSLSLSRSVPFTFQHSCSRVAKTEPMSRWAAGDGMRFETILPRASRPHEEQEMVEILPPGAQRHHCYPTCRRVICLFVLLGMLLCCAASGVIIGWVVLWTRRIFVQFLSLHPVGIACGEYCTVVIQLLITPLRSDDEGACPRRELSKPPAAYEVRGTSVVPC
jgi:hypothetical protein